MSDRPFELQSRDEKILAAIIDGTEYTDVPQSRIEYLLLELNGTLDGKADLDENGLIPTSELPPVVFEHMVTVANDTARFALTTEDVQNGDTVKVNSTGLMYFVIDDTKLDSEQGYQEYVAGTAAKAIGDKNGNDITTTYQPKIDSEHKLSSDLVDDLTDKTVRNKTIHYYKGIWDISNGELTILNNKMMEFKADTYDRLRPAPSNPNTYPPVYLELYKKNNDTYSFCGICEYDGYKDRFTGMRYTTLQSGGEDIIYDIKFITFQTMYVSSSNKITLYDYNETSSCDLKLVDYSKPQTTSAITNTDTVSSAIGKLEKGLDTKQDALTFDTVPTQGSTNPVESGGVYTALAGKLPDKTTHTTINGIDVYVSNTQPTGDIAVGSVGIGW